MPGGTRARGFSGGNGVPIRGGHRGPHARLAMVPSRRKALGLPTQRCGASIGLQENCAVAGVRRFILVGLGRAETLPVSLGAMTGMAEHHTVLVVEDDYDIRDAFAALARSVGLDAVVAENGRAALDILRGGLRPCVIVLDMAMPEMDGLTFRRAQLDDPAIADIPVAVVTGGGWATEADARKLGLTVVLRKPVDPSNLLRVLTDHRDASP